MTFLNHSNNIKVLFKYRRKRFKAMETQSKSSNFLAGSILAAALIIGGSFIYGSRLGQADADKPLAQVGANRETPAVNTNNPTADDDVILGDPDAPVTMIEFGDYQCPFCRKLFTETEIQLRKEYIETGKLRMIYRDFPLDQIHPFARPAAEAAECARDQGKYWIYHDMLFTKQDDLATLDFALEAGKLGLDQSQFKECYQNKKYAAEVEKDYQDGLAAGVTGTPANFINGKFLPGAQPYEVFKAAIEEALRNS